MIFPEMSPIVIGNLYRAISIEKGEKAPGLDGVKGKFSKTFNKTDPLLCELF